MSNSSDYNVDSWACIILSVMFTFQANSWGYIGETGKSTCFYIIGLIWLILALISFYRLYNARSQWA